MTGVAFAIALILEMLFKGCSPAFQNKQSVVSRVAKWCFTALQNRIKRVANLQPPQENSSTEKDKIYEKQLVKANAKLTQEQRKTNAKSTQAGGKVVAKPSTSVANVTLACFADVSDETLGNYVDLPENMNDSLKIALAYILIIYSENPKKGKTIPERTTSDEIGERTRHAPSWMKAIIPDQGVNHKSIAMAKKLLHEMGYLNKKISGTKKKRAYYSWKSPEEVLSVIKKRIPPNNVIEINRL